MVGSTCFAMNSNIFGFVFESFSKPAGLGSSLGSSGLGIVKLPSTAPSPWQVLQLISPYRGVSTATNKSCILGETVFCIHASLSSCVHLAHSPGPGWYTPAPAGRPALAARPEGVAGVGASPPPHA